jgi:protein-S-isoprenylcysteine O-methyltransferase Ste14
MHMGRFYNILFTMLWVAWVTYWWALSRSVKVNVRRESVYSRRSYLVALLLAVVLLSVPDLPIAFLGRRFLPAATWALWNGIGAALVVAGLLFTVWAREHLGRNWSDVVTIKVDHELVTSGPYRAVRHPIYTGLLVAFLGQALARGEWRGLLAVALALWAFWRKSQVEERLMREQFGTAYEEYSQRVAALIPLVF